MLSLEVTDVGKQVGKKVQLTVDKGLAACDRVNGRGSPTNCLFYWNLASFLSRSTGFRIF